ncbi:aldo/keto reductase family oxidoreductase [Paenibacillus sp. NFR01]|uniref:aldo/keto reductase n=1 Tax=Paenibacillus sp. NFR01 TaxID=1566279 RepID=UPI0008C9DF6A|nr:aldo/keto reductase [Paenibacillus sp. NFR01]SEU23968.1 Predicted oxidoreductase [Paenibacillus sp. NFR01]
MPTTLPLNQRGIPASRIALGCMGIGGEWNREPVTAAELKEGQAAVEAALAAGINMFDHADIYTRGKAETIFGTILKDHPGLRDKIILQSKCGIKLMEPGDLSNTFDFSKEHILSSVDGTLARLGTPYLDILLLHRPDPLMDPEEVGEALRLLKAAGKVRHFGVSNMSAAQIRLLQAHCDEPFIVNQLHMSLARLDWIEAVIGINREPWREISFPEGTIEHCRLENIQIQAFGPLAQGLFTGRSLEGQPERVANTAEMIRRLAEEKGVSREAILLSWLMTHPAGIQPVIGTVNPQRIAACMEVEGLELSRKEWYDLFVTARGRFI